MPTSGLPHPALPILGHLCLGISLSPPLDRELVREGPGLVWSPLCPQYCPAQARHGESTQGRFARLKRRSTQAHMQTPPRRHHRPTHLQTREWTKELPGTSFHTGTPGTHSPAPLTPAHIPSARAARYTLSSTAPFHLPEESSQLGFWFWFINVGVYGVCTKEGSHKYQGRFLEDLHQLVLKYLSLSPTIYFPKTAGRIPLKCESAPVTLLLRSSPSE